MAIGLLSPLPFPSFPIALLPRCLPLNSRAKEKAAQFSGLESARCDFFYTRDSPCRSTAPIHQQRHGLMLLSQIQANWHKTAAFSIRGRTNKVYRRAFYHKRLQRRLTFPGGALPTWPGARYSTGPVGSAAFSPTPSHAATAEFPRGCQRAAPPAPPSHDILRAACNGGSRGALAYAP